MFLCWFAGINLGDVDSYLHITHDRYVPFTVIAVLKQVNGNKPVIYYEDPNWMHIPRAISVDLPVRKVNDPHFYVLIQPDPPVRL